MDIPVLRKAIRAAAFAAALTCASVVQAAPSIFGGTLLGSSESPPNASPATGFTTVTIDPVTHQMTVFVTFSGLLGTTTASHIHAPTPTPLTGTAGVATQTPTFVALPLGVTSGTFSQTLDMTLASSYNPAFITANGGSISASESALFAAIGSGQAYLNIHTSQFPGGEVRAFLVPVPEPATWLLMLVGFGGIGMALRRRASLAAA